MNATSGTTGENAAPGRFASKGDAGHSIALAFVLIVGALFAVGLLAHIDALYGPWYWKWLERDLGLARTLTFLAPPFAIFVLAWWLAEQSRFAQRSAALPIVLLMAANFGLQFMALLCIPQGFDRLAAIVVSPGATSYFTDAQQISDLVPWLRNFHEAKLGLHSATHPPGPILYYYFWLKLLGPSTGAVVGGLGVGVIATLGIPTMYAFAGLWTAERRTRLLACAMYALLPALMVFFPEFDQIYPIFAMLIVLAWVKALQGSTAYSLLLVAALFAATFFAYNLLVVGTFLALYAAYFLWEQHWAPAIWKQVLRVAAIALGVVVAIYILLWLATGYDPIRSLAHAVREQNDLQARLMRPWSSGLVFAPYDFFLGSGMIAAPLIVLFLRRAFAEFDWKRSDLVLSLIALATILVVDVSGVLRAETARIWLFLQPFALVPASSEMLRFGVRGRIAIFAMQWFVAATLLCKISFLDP